MKTSSTRLATLLGAGALLAACGDNITPAGGIDGPLPPDASRPDADPDSTYSGSITVLEASVLGAPQLGQGIQVGASFFRDGTNDPVYEDQQGSPLGCKVWEYTPAQAADVGLNEGPITITIDNDPDTEGVQGPAIPACVFVPTRGYVCPDTIAMGGAVAGVPVDPTEVPPGPCRTGVLALTDTDQPFTFEVTDGRYITFVGADHPLLPDGAAFPIVQKVDLPLENATVVFAHPAITTDTCTPLITLPEAAVHTTLGGVGPIPGIGGDGMMTNTAAVTITLTEGGEMHVPTLTATYPTPRGPGNAFTLPAEAAGLMLSVPLDGSTFTVSCTGGTGCPEPNPQDPPPPTADGSILNIVTTDATAGLESPISMPPPATKRVQVRCASLGSQSVVVSAAASAYLMDSGATRIQSTFIRGNLSQHGGAGDQYFVNVVAGHAITAFFTVPASAQ
jgi:hypothetical protein